MKHHSHRPRARIYSEERLRQHSRFALPAKTVHYLISVLRVKAGEYLALFNAEDGEWLAEITLAAKKEVTITLLEQRREARPSPDFWLVFTPIKAGRIDFLVEKATELGVSELFPVNTDYTNTSRVNTERLRAQAVEAAEQCERFDVPALHDFQSLEKLIAAWPEDRPLLYCDESGGGAPIAETLKQRKPGKLALLIGPEGGFSPKERERLTSLPYTVPMGLGPRILRAETAAVAALACVQSLLGDWSAMPDFRGEER